MLTCLLAIPVAPRDEKASRQLKKLYGPKEKEAFSVSTELKDILIGLLLGNLYAEKQKASKNARLQFKESTAHKEYLDHLYDLFKEYGGTKPKISFLFDSRPDTLVDLFTVPPKYY